MVMKYATDFCDGRTEIPRHSNSLAVITSKNLKTNCNNELNGDMSKTLSWKSAELSSIARW